MKIVDFEKAKKEREPHLQGNAICAGCRHKWEAIAPIGTDRLECPECHSNKGVFVELVEREHLRWTCNCGNYLMAITPEGTYCVNCGAWQEVKYENC